MKKMSNTLILQDNALTTARYEMTALEKNIMYSVMSQIEDNDSAAKYYKISIQNISKFTERRVRHDDFESAIQRLLTRDFTIKKPDGKNLQITFISSAEYDTDGSVEIGIDLKMRPYLFALKKNFTSFGLEVAMSLNSKYSKRLYEMLCQFRSTGLLRLTVKELKDRFQLISPSGEEQYARWSSFENNVLKTAQAEINEKANFQFDYELRKQGRKIAAIDFLFRKETEANPAPPPPPQAKSEGTPKDPKMARMIERLTNYGLTSLQINNVLKKHSPERINKVLYDTDCNKDNIHSTSALLCKIFEL
jgi:plasmid replication initiation protein